MTEKFMMVSLNEKKAKKLAEVLSNNTSRKILDYLSEREATAADISKDLKIPLSTVDYNLKNLMQNSLLEVKEFKWSPKGRQQDIYKIKKKYIVIAPGKKEASTFKEALKKILPISLIGLIASLGIEYFTRTKSAIQDTSRQAFAQIETADAMLAQESQKIIETTQYSLSGLYFFIGFVLALVLFIIFLEKTKKNV